MKKNLFLAASLVFALASCQKLDGVSPGSDNSTSSLSSSGTVVPMSSVPQSVKDFIATKYLGYAIHEVQTELEHGVSYFQVDIRKGSNDRKKLLFTKSWVFVKEKA